MRSTYPKRMWTTTNGVGHRVVDGLLSLHLAHYESNKLVEGLSVLMRRLTHSEPPDPISFAKIHRASRMAYELTSSMIVTSMDSIDVELISQVKSEVSLQKVFDVISAERANLRVIRHEDVLQAHEAVASIHSTMES